MVRRSAILLGLAIVFAPAAYAQQAPTSRSKSIDALINDPALGRDNPELRRRLEEIHGFASVIQNDFAVSDLPGATAGFKFTFDERGEPVLVRSPTTKPGDTLITDDALGRLRAMKTLDAEELLKELQKQRSNPLLTNDAAKSVNPGSTDHKPQTLPAAWKARADETRWNGAQGNFDEACPGRRDEFANGPEKALLGKNKDPTKSVQEPKRGRYISAIKAYEDACLSSVAPGDLPTDGPPLRTVAVLQSITPFCMATHLGGEFFLTAWHCWFDDDGKPKKGHETFTVSLINGSASNVPVVLAAAQPVPSPSLTKVGHDMVVLRAESLPPDVKVLSGPTLLASINLPKVMLSEAYVVGYFTLSNPEGVIGKPDGTPGRLPAWNEALRTTAKVRRGYCQAWDYTPPSMDGVACIQHSCQTMKGFSGAPVFVRRDNGAWQLAGVHVASGEAADARCDAFASGKPGGFMQGGGGLAAALPKTMTMAAASIGTGTASGR